MEWTFHYGLATGQAAHVTINGKAEGQWREQGLEKQKGGWVNPIRPSL